jgi:hypothetical protein
VVFRSGHYDPGSSAGQRTIAHELSHVVQQSRGPVDGSDAPGGIRVSDPGDHHERAAEHEADRVMASAGSGPGTANTSASPGQAVQREEDSSLPVPVQREDAATDEDEMPTGG